MKALNIIKILAIHLHKELHKYTANHQSTTAMTHSLLNEKQEQCQRTTRLITKKLDKHECPKMNSLFIFVSEYGYLFYACQYIYTIPPYKKLKRAYDTVNT